MEQPSPNGVNLALSNSLNRLLRPDEEQAKPPEQAYPLRWELQDTCFLGYLVMALTLVGLLSVISGLDDPHYRLIDSYVFIGLVSMSARLLPRLWNHPLPRFLRWWYPALLCPFCFETTGQAIHFLQRPLIDASLVSADHFLFGQQLTPLLQQHANPWLTELMYLFYTSYYFFIPGIGFPLYLRTNPNHLEPTTAFREFMLAVSLTFWVCFLHFLLTPAGGPIFWPDYPGPVMEPVGGPITVLERWIFSNGTIVGGAFPSSHVAVAMVATVYAIRFRVAPLFFVPVFIGLAVSTVYNGYHYAIDVFYGMVVAVVMLFIVSKLPVCRTAPQ